MILPRLLLAASAAVILASCGGTGRVDASYPTISELDRLDAQWGLEPRKSRGAPKRSYRYSAPAPSYGSPAAPAAMSPIPARETINTPPPAISTPQLDPAAINSLR